MPTRIQKATKSNENKHRLVQHRRAEVVEKEEDKFCKNSVNGDSAHKNEKTMLLVNETERKQHCSVGHALFFKVFTQHLHGVKERAMSLERSSLDFLQTQ